MRLYSSKKAAAHKSAAGKQDAGSSMRIWEEQKYILNSKSGFFVREAYNTLRTNVNFSLTGDEKCKVILITSSSPGEGKSISSINLAISFAEADSRVLLIDCDLRKPMLNRLMGLKSDVGLSDILMDPSAVDNAILGFRNIENLNVIPSGKIPPNPSELLGSARMERLLASLRERYDYIILDTPPVNMVTDAVVLASYADGTLFIVRAGISDKVSTSYAIEQMEYVQTKVLGFVFNGVDITKTGYAYGKYGYKSYGYRRHGYGRYGYGRHGYGYGGYGYEYGYGRPAEEAAPGNAKEKA